MFRKAFKIKRNTQIKGTEKKNLKEQMLKSFTCLADDDVENIIPKKENVNVLKVITASQETINVFTIQKRPLVFEYEGVLFPTVYLLWKYPNLLLTFSTHSNVMSYIVSGADFMLPGLAEPVSKYGAFTENIPVAINFNTNKAAVIVGVTAQSSNAMALANGKGKCVKVYHYYGDNLCSLEGLQKLPLPELGATKFCALENYNENFPQLEKKEVHMPSVEKEEIPAVSPETPENENAATEEIGPDDMNDLLFHSFLAALKYSKNMTLPILTSNFYKLQMVPYCPQDKNLDVKKSSYKKFGSFIDAMANMGLITVKEMKKGVQAISSINKDHPKYNEFFIPKSERPNNQNNDQKTPSTTVDQGYIITNVVAPIFLEFGLNKGDVVQSSDIRKYVTEFVKKNNYQDESNGGLVHTKDVLSNVCKTEGLITWGELMEKVCDAMKSCYKVSSDNTQMFNKGKVNPISLTVANRAGNKKVTLVDNLEVFGISISEFAKECQHGAAASTSISRPPGHKFDQLLIQGNQVLFVYNLLVEKYNIQKSFIRGLEYAPKKKK